ncbi:MAG TPA: hypothetical protein VFN67_40135 [Polyangiales bacterium]|nr:hypothetical protein [Polyangiales bacterium]
MRRVPFWSWLPLCALFALACGSEDPPIDRVGVNVVEKALFQGSWYMSRTVIDVDYEAGGLGTFPGDAASDQAMDFTAIPRIRWVIDEDTLFAYRDYPLVPGGDGDDKSDVARRTAAAKSDADPSKSASDTDKKDLSSLPVAAYKIEKHFDIRRAYEPSTGEERNVVEENAEDKPWYGRKYMRVDWSKNLLPGYFGQTQDLNELLGMYKRESTSLYVQDSSQFPASYKPRFDRMRCDGLEDKADSCTTQERDLAADYAKDELYHMSFVSQEVLSPGRVPDPETGEEINWCAAKLYSDAPPCSSVVTYVRTSFLKVSDKRQYEPLNFSDDRFERFGYFRLSSAVVDRSTGKPDDPSFGITDFRNYNINRHNIWQQWHDKDGKSIPYADRDVRQIVWYTTPELPAHLVQPSFDLVGQWNENFMATVRSLRGEALPSYPEVSCQKDDPDGYCYCDEDPDNGEIHNPTCAGKYDPFKKPADSGASNPYDCYVEVPKEAGDIDMNDPGLSDKAFNPWFGAKFVGSECVTVLRNNTCNKASLAAHDEAKAKDASLKDLACEERGDMRYKFLSYVAMPGTGFLGIATLRGDPVTGEILAGDANIGGPALDSYRTSALQTFDLVSGRLTDTQLQVGEDVRGYFENLGKVSLPPRPRSDFNVASRTLGADMSAELDGRMKAAMQRLNKLQGPDGRQAVMSDRKQKLIGTDIERRLVAGLQEAALSPIIAPGASVSSFTDAQLNQISPLRNSIDKRLAEQRERATRYSKRNVELGNEYTDDSVLWFVSRHQDWPRARLEFEVNRLLYRQTELHELGHCFGLRHDFGASADSEHYSDEYYTISRRYPLPTETEFDTDNNNELSDDERKSYQEAYDQQRSRREKAGIDGAMSSSVMEYTANWYERMQPLGKYDAAAIAYGYGNLVEAYQGPAAYNTPRTILHYYQGGETCSADSDCPYSAGGSRSAELLSNNMSQGITQRCVDNPRVNGARVCSSSDDDLAASAANGGELSPLKYRFCTDERADSTLGWCNRFDEGDSYRDMVRNIEESYDRMYLFSAFRRYRSNFSANQYMDALIGRRLNILQVVYQNMIFQYLNDPGYRQQTGNFGFYDQFLATTDILNFYGRILGQPSVGGYIYVPQTGTYQRAFADSADTRAEVAVPLGLGRYFNSDYQAGLTGIERLERVGSFFDKIRVIELLSQRGISVDYTRDVPFFANYYDLFPNEMQQIFQGMIRGNAKAISPRVVCTAGGMGSRCENPHLQYLDFYRGDCSQKDTRPEACHEDTSDVTYANQAALDGGGNVTLQVYAALAGLSEFPVYFDTTFQSQLFICIEGQADCYQPGSKAMEGKDFVRYTSPRYRRTFVAFQVEPTQTVSTQTSIGFAMVKEARDLDTILAALEKMRDGQVPNSPDNLTDEDRAALMELKYEVPTTPPAISDEIDRVSSQVTNLESFFNQLIELQRQLGIQNISIFN